MVGPDPSRLVSQVIGVGPVPEYYAKASWPPGLQASRRKVCRLMLDPRLLPPETGLALPLELSLVS